MYLFIYLFISIIIIIIIIITWTFIGKEFLAKCQLHKVSKNNFTSNGGALP